MTQRWLAVALGAAIVACAAAPARSDSAARPALDLTEKGKTSGDGTQTRFARSVAARYPSGTPAAEILADLATQGFSCDTDGTYCTRAEMDGVCADAWTVDLAANGRASGALTRRCMGALVDDE